MLQSRVSGFDSRRRLSSADFCSRSGAHVVRPLLPVGTRHTLIWPVCGTQSGAPRSRLATRHRLVGRRVVEQSDQGWVKAPGSI